MNIRPLESDDRSALFDILLSVGNFNAMEVKVAMELIEDRLTKQETSDYAIYVLEDSNRVIVGYVCFGKTPLTASTYDFYWMAVHPKYQRRGFGRMLIKFVEHEVLSRGGKRLILETSSLESYQRTVQIYRHAGYEMVARVRDFYRDGDDKLIFVKEIHS
jgi:ribosomal protein S18 acetylase RimI-like enzyme